MQVKRGVRFSRIGDGLIEVPEGQVDDRLLKRDPVRFIKAVQAFAEAAECDPQKFTDGSRRRTGLWAEFKNMVDPTLLIAVSDQSTADQLIYFAKKAKLSGRLTDSPLKFDRP